MSILETITQQHFSQGDTETAHHSTSSRNAAADTPRLPLGSTVADAGASLVPRDNSRDEK